MPAHRRSEFGGGVWSRLNDDLYRWWSCYSISALGMRLQPRGGAVDHCHRAAHLDLAVHELALFTGLDRAVIYTGEAGQARPRRTFHFF